MRTAALKLRTIQIYGLITCLALFFAFLIAKTAFLIPLTIIALAICMYVLYQIGVEIRNGFYLLMAANFFIVGLTRYVSLPLGLFIDFLLLFLFLLFFIKNLKGISWKPLANPVFIAVSIWMLINIFEIANPEAHSLEAWFYAMRGVTLYFFLTLLIAYLCLHHNKDFKWFITLWFLFSIVGTLWGMKQIFIGLDSYETAWLNVPGNFSTHVLFGKMRVFSFYSDSGQFGASQAHTGLVAAILTISEKHKGRKIFYFFTAILSFYGMLISGTRGAFAIPVIGFFTYLILIKNVKIILIGTSFFALIFILLKFTFIGQGYREISRLRTSLNPNDPSLQIRIENQKKLGSYLKGHWLGGGVGTGGYWGQRFSPNTFLANLALDSWYVRIAAEYGYFGLLYYVLMLLFILFIARKKIVSEDDPKTKNQLIALFCGLAGVLVASYGNQVFGQLPTGIIIYLSISFLTGNDQIPTYKKNEYAS